MLPCCALSIYKTQLSPPSSHIISTFHIILSGCVLIGLPAVQIIILVQRRTFKWITVNDFGINVDCLCVCFLNSLNCTHCQQFTWQIDTGVTCELRACDHSSHYQLTWVCAIILWIHQLARIFTMV